MLRFEITSIVNKDKADNTRITGYLIIDNEDKIRISLDISDFNDLILSSIPVMCCGIEIKNLDENTILNIDILLKERNIQNA